MTIDRLIEVLGEHKGDTSHSCMDQGVMFYDYDNDRWLELMPQDHDGCPGIEADRLQCGCVAGVIFNLREESKNED